MITRDLLHQPICSVEELGRSIPDSIHAVSVALPRWQDVVGYEEGRPEVLTKLMGGYPRFVIHPLVRELGRLIGLGATCLPFPSQRAAELGAAFVRRASGAEARITAGYGVWGVVTTEAGGASLKAYWQHAGLIVSSRQAEAALAGRTRQPEAVAVRQSLRQQVAAYYDCDATDVFLTPTGMAAHFGALQTVNLRRPGQPTAQLGFPYVDTFKLQQKLGAGAHLLHDVNHLATELRPLLERASLGACFCEIPGNPLLGSADVRQVTPLIRAHGVPLIVDDVVATALNVDLRPYADLIVTSLTKYMAGTGDVMGGALICNPRSPYHAELKPLAQVQHEELLWGEDALVLDQQARGFPERMRRHNQNGRLIAERLRAHPRVERIWYPQWESSGAYEAVRRPEGGWGSLLTFLPEKAETRAARVFDRMAVCKGPSLGTIFTLACPFTLLAHYNELAWAEACGVSRFLIRLSVGLEEPEELWTRIQTAIEA